MSRQMLMAAAAFLVAVALVVCAYALRSDPQPLVGQVGTVEELLKQFSTRADREFTSAGVAMLALGVVAALAGSALLLRALRRR